MLFTSGGIAFDSSISKYPNELIKYNAGHFEMLLGEGDINDF